MESLEDLRIIALEAAVKICGQTTPEHVVDTAEKLLSYLKGEYTGK